MSKETFSNVIYTEDVIELKIGYRLLGTSRKASFKTICNQKTSRNNTLKLIRTYEGTKYFPVTELVVGSIKGLKLFVSDEDRTFIETINNMSLPVPVTILCRDGSSYEGINMYITGLLELVASEKSMTINLEGDLSKKENKKE